MRASLTAKAASLTFHDVIIIDVSCPYSKVELLNCFDLVLSYLFWVSAIMLHRNRGAIGEFQMKEEPNNSVL